MDSKFRITDPSTATTGDYVSFLIHERDGTLAAKISNTALRHLAGAENYDRLEVFNANIDKISAAAYNARRRDPSKVEVALLVIDFGGLV
ncbi:hypothetical protein [Paraburkholderia tropica]|uniref:hypothetical protein n=1 Tax=Paraburkholderia tropica TaxID=92647 RepID=UPI002AB7F1FA|nr:hypothetical protein [Paraburkholderia tropica]